MDIASISNISDIKDDAEDDDDDDDKKNDMLESKEIMDYDEREIIQRAMYPLYFTLKVNNVNDFDYAQCKQSIYQCFEKYNLKQQEIQITMKQDKKSVGKKKKRKKTKKKNANNNNTNNNNNNKEQKPDIDVLQEEKQQEKVSFEVELQFINWRDSENVLRNKCKYQFYYDNEYYTPQRPQQKFEQAKVLPQWKVMMKVQKHFVVYCEVPLKVMKYKNKDVNDIKNVVIIACKNLEDLTQNPNLQIVSSTTNDILRVEVNFGNENAKKQLRFKI